MELHTSAGLRAKRAARPQRGDTDHAARLHTAPPLNRRSMAPAQGKGVSARAMRASWRRPGMIRRSVLLALVTAQTLLATHYAANVLPYNGTEPLEMLVLGLFVVLFGWVSAGFWTALMGFALLVRGGDRYAISHGAAADAPIRSAARTAVIMPICNEHVPRVFAGLRATYESLARTGQLEHFDFFVLSDSDDADTRTAELAAWAELCRAVGGFGRIFYRRRVHRIKRKSGNVADFCRRWGANYRYMVVLDADSVMSGDCLVRLAQLMEAHPQAGIIQTAPIAAGRETFYARMQQFATRVYGPLFTAGLHYWQLGESHYWGHNAIIRIEPFMRHCALERLPGRGTLSGEILSHDFVEAALMRRAGWGVWIAYDLPGSYEEMPPNLLDELKRDRRWCHGNLMNFRLFMTEGLHPAHRAVFMTGVMAYLSAPLWFLSLILSTVMLALHTLIEPEYFVVPHQLFPRWPEWHPELAMTLFATTAGLLFLPKILGALRAATGAGLRALPRLLLGLFVESVFSALLAPVRMLFHSRFVFAALTGWKIQWKSPPREDSETSWSEAAREHGLHTLVGLAWGGLVYWLNPAFLLWLSPVVGALVLSIPLSVLTSRVGWGRSARRAGCFVIPEELRPPRELRWTRHYVLHAVRAPGFVDAVVDPKVNALMCAAARVRSKQPVSIREERERLVGEALIAGPDALTEAQRRRLLDDRSALARLHREVRQSPFAHEGWYAQDEAAAHAQRAAREPGATEAAPWEEGIPAWREAGTSQLPAPARPS